MKVAEITHLLKTAWQNFKRNKARSILTSLGIMIGVLSVVLLIALGLGLKTYLKEQFESLGSNLIMLFPGNVFNDEAGAGGGFGPGFAGGTEFDEKDYLALKKIEDADYVVPVFFKSMTLKNNTKILYYMSAYYKPSKEKSIRYNDKFFSIKWPNKPKCISKKDLSIPDFNINE